MLREFVNSIATTRGPSVFEIHKPCPFVGVYLQLSGPRLRNADCHIATGDLTLERLLAMSQRMVRQAIASAAVAIFFSTGSLNASEFYFQVGASHWRDVPSIGVPSATAHANPNAWGFYEESWGYTIGAGYAVNERWSLEANYCQAPTVRVLVGHAHGILYPRQQQVPSGYIQETTIKTHVFSTAPVFELSLGRFTSILGKLGVVHAYRNSKTSVWGLGSESSAPTVPDLPVDRRDTHIFLTAGVRTAFPFVGDSSTGLSYQRYFGIGREYESSVTFDIQFRF